MASGLAQKGTLAARNNSTQQLDATLVQIGTAPIVYSAELDNTGNSSEVFVKFFNAASPTLGTTAPDEIVAVPALTKIMHHFNGGDGLSFPTGCWVGCVTTAGTPGTASPTNSVAAEIRTDGN